MKRVFQASITCRLDIIGFIAMTSITTGVIGAVIATGTIRVGIKNIPGNIGPVKNFINHHQGIPVVGEGRMTNVQEVMLNLLIRALRENWLSQALTKRGLEAILDMLSKVESMAKTKERPPKSLEVRESKAIHQKRISHQLS
jgi:hypothetical protein